MARLGQTFELRTTDEGQLQLRRVGNTALQPFEPTRVILPPGTRRVRVTYHYAEERHERRSPAPSDALVVELAALNAP